jgi:hypothetical protein
MWKRAAEAESVCSPWELSKYLITLCVVVPTSHDSKKLLNAWWASEPTCLCFSLSQNKIKLVK